jgi:predicted aspartyl protease
VQTLPASRPLPAFLPLRPLLPLLALFSSCIQPTSLVDRQAATLVNNLPVIYVRIDRSAPLPFILDTGASSTVIDRAVATRLGLTMTAGSDVTTGGGSVESTEIRDVIIDVGRLPLPNLTLAAIDLAPLSSGLGLPISGILGFDVFKEFVVQIDYANRVVGFHNAARYSAPADADRIPITFQDQVPFVPGEIIGPSGSTAVRLVFDTGQTGALTLVRPFVDKQRLLTPGQPEVPITTGALLPGQVAATVTRINSMKLGRFTLGHIVTTVAANAEAAGLEDDATGILGGALLKRFAVTIDYSRRQVILESRSDEGLAEPTEFDMSGLSLAAQGESYREYRVRLVIPGSPAAEAGIMTGDLIGAINGRSAAELTLNEIRELFRTDGQQYPLELRRGSESVAVILRTRRLL